LRRIDAWLKMPSVRLAIPRSLLLRADEVIE